MLGVPEKGDDELEKGFWMLPVASHSPTQQHQGGTPAGTYDNGLQADLAGQHLCRLFFLILSKLDLKGGQAADELTHPASFIQRKRGTHPPLLCG